MVRTNSLGSPGLPAEGGAGLALRGEKRNRNAQRAR